MIIDKALAKVFGTANERELKRLTPVVAEINALEPSLTSLSDDQLRAKTAEFRLRSRPAGLARSSLEGGGRPRQWYRAPPC